MKKISLVSWSILTALIFFVSCNQNKTADKVESNPLVGSSWLATSTSIEKLNDTIFIFTSNVAIKFLDDSTGVMVSDHRVFANDTTELADQPIRTPFSYSFENGQGTMTLDFGEADTVHDFPRFVDNTFQYNQEQQTISTFAPNGKSLNEFSELK